MANNIEARNRVIGAINENHGKSGLPIKLKCLDRSTYGKITRISDIWFRGVGINAFDYPLIEASTFVAARLSRIDGVDTVTAKEWEEFKRPDNKEKVSELLKAANPAGFTSPFEGVPKGDKSEVGVWLFKPEKP